MVPDPIVWTCSEEYEPDARYNQEATSLDGPEATSLAKIDAEGYDRLVQFVRYFGLYYGNYTMEKTREVFKCAFNRLELEQQDWRLCAWPLLCLQCAQTSEES